MPHWADCATGSGTRNSMDKINKKFRWAVFVSGEGTNLQNFLDIEQTSLQCHTIVGIYADRQCRAIQRAQEAGKPVLILSPSSKEWEEKIFYFLKEHQANHLFLMGYMKILTVEFLKKWGKRTINLHPSLLPHYRGLHAVERAVAAGESTLGVTLHEVTASLDAGPVLRQLQFLRDPAWSLQKIFDKVHEYERKIVHDYLRELERKSFGSGGLNGFI